MELIYNLELNVRYGEVGHDGVATLTSLANWLQEAAGLSADSLGFGEESLAEFGITWILSRLVLRIKRLPGSGERITVRSWPSTQGRFAHRGYQVLDADANLLVSGGSAWTIMDLATRRMATVPAQLTQRYPSTPPPCDDFSCRVLPRLADPDAAASAWRGSANIVVRRDDLDINRHVNNAHYLSWLLESLPYTPGQTLAPALIDLGFRSECFPGEELISLAAPAKEQTNPDPALFAAPPLTLVHAIRRSARDGAPGEDVCRAITAWRDLALDEGR